MLKLGKEKKTTKTVGSTRSPKWNETFTFGAGKSASVDAENGELVVEVMSGKKGASLGPAFL